MYIREGLKGVSEYSGVDDRAFYNLGRSSWYVLLPAVNTAKLFCKPPPPWEDLYLTRRLR